MAGQERIAATAPVLVVDLDGTLLRSDLLQECFWAAWARHWWTPLAAAQALGRGGKPALKHRMGALAAPDPASLPYDVQVLDRLRDWRARGGRTALVTAADAGLAEGIAAYLGLFDEVHGSRPGVNLKGEAKAALLAERFGPGGYVYVGDAEADLPVWAGAAEAVTLTPSAALRRRVEAEMAGRPVTHLQVAAPSARVWARALRPHQWMKNVLVFVPMLTAHQLDAGTFALSALAFVAFSMVASAVYLLNDLLDLASDRAHPRKRNRPFAAGALPLAQGGLLVPVLMLAGLALAAALGPRFLAVMALYVVATTAYSLYLKRKAVVDISVLAGLYTVRILAGAAAAGIALSVWLLAFSIFLFFALAAVKRQAELVDSAAAGKEVAHGRGYQVGDLPLISSMALAAGYVSVLVMALYITSPEVTALYSQPYALWGICLVQLYWISRVVMIAHRGRMHDDPVVFALRDRISLACMALVVASAMAGVWL